MPKMQQLHKGAAISAAVMLISALIGLFAARSANADDSFIAATSSPSGAGYWAVRSDGTVKASGGANDYGDLAGRHINKSVVGISATPSGHGYWIVAADGGVFNFGDASFSGSAANLILNRNITAISGTSTGNGYWLVGTDGGVFAYGDARFYGSATNLHLNKSIVGMTPTPSGNGYWLVAADGGVFAYGDARFLGGASALHLNKPIISITALGSGSGYLLTARDGGVFAYGDATFDNTGTAKPSSNTIGLVSTGSGYLLIDADAHALHLQARSTGTTTTTVALTTTTTIPTTTTTTAPHATLSPESFGAIGNGSHDDTTALQAAINALTSGDTLQLTTGKTYRHTGVLHINNNGSIISGLGTLLATNQTSSALYIDADNVQVKDITVSFVQAGATRQTTPDTAAIVVHNSGAIIDGVRIEGSASSGIFIEGASNYVIQDVVVSNTLADAIHNTYRSHNGQIIRPRIYNPGDDGVAIFSYISDGAVSHDIKVVSPRMYGQTHGRGFTVVGGDNIEFDDVYVADAAGAGIYVASEKGSYTTYGSTHVKVLGGTVLRANSVTSDDYGAILVSIQADGSVNSDVLIKDITVTDTNTAASRNLGIISPASPSPNLRIEYRNITLTGGPATFLSTTGTPSGQYNLYNSSQNGSPVADHAGF